MTEVSGKIDIFSSEKEFNFEVFTWKIPNVSSIPHVVDYVIQSPSFYFGSTFWTLKMYPNGQKKNQTEGFVDISIERLQPQNEVICKMYCKDVFDKDLKEISRTFSPSLKTANVYSYIQNLKELPEKWQFVPNDTFTLVFKFQLSDKPKNEPDSQKTSVGTAEGVKHAVSKNERKTEIGEISKALQEVKAVYCKVYFLTNTRQLVPPFPLPAGYHEQSPQFSFMNATWVLKIWPHCQMEPRKSDYDIILHRLHSEVPVHHIIVRVSDGHFMYERCYFFSEHNTQGDAFNFASASVTFFKIEMKTMKIDEIGLLPQIKSVTRHQVSDKKSESSMMLQKNKVLQDLKDLFLKQEDCDVIFKVKEQEFPAHRVILIARSPVLASTFRNDMKEKATGVIDVEDCNPSHFLDFLNFLYCGEAEILTVDNVFSLFTAADKYDVPDLRHNCMEFMKHNLSIETFCDTIALALLHSESELIKLSIDFFAKNLKKIIVTVKWQSFIVENPIQGNELMIKALVD